MEYSLAIKAFAHFIPLSIAIQGNAVVRYIETTNWNKSRQKNNNLHDDNISLSKVFGCILRYGLRRDRLFKFFVYIVGCQSINFFHLLVLLQGI